MKRILQAILGVIVSIAVLIGLALFRGESRYSSAIAHGKSKADVGNVNGAFLSYGDAIRMDPKRTDVYFLRATAMLKLKSNTKAQMDLNDGIRLRPNFGEAYRLRAVCFRARGLTEKADEDDANADRLGAPKSIDDPEKVVFP